jgi:hypothetical protein
MSTNKEKLMFSVTACEEGEHNFTHELSTIAMKCRQWYRDLECKRKIVWIIWSCKFDHIYATMLPIYYHKQGFL